jgi:hypothetical protein
MKIGFGSPRKKASHFTSVVRLGRPSETESLCDDSARRAKPSIRTRRLSLLGVERGPAARGACLAPKGPCLQSRRDGPIVAWHEVPGTAPPQKSRPVGYGLIRAGIRTDSMIEVISSLKHDVPFDAK